MADSQDSSGSGSRSLGGMLTEAIPDLWRWILRKRGTERLGGESAGDLVQSVCREALEARSNFEDRGDRPFRAWMKTLTERKLADRARHWNAARREASRRESVGDFTVEEPRAAPDTLAGQRDLAEHLGRFLDELPPDQAAVLRLQVEGELTTAEVAERLGKSEGAVRILRCRGLATMGRLLKDAEARSARGRAAPPG